MSLDDNYDMEAIYRSIAVIILIIFIIIAGIWYVSYHASDKYRETCRNNPMERYAQRCNTYDECVTLCTTRLRNAGQ